MVWRGPNIQGKVKLPRRRLELSPQNVLMHAIRIRDKLLYGAVRETDQVVCRVVDRANQRVELWPGTAVVGEVTDGNKLNQSL